MRNPRTFKPARLLAVGLLGIFSFSFPGTAQSAPIGKTLDEIVELAKKEAEVRVATSWEPELEPQLLKGFHDRYPAIKARNTRVSGIASRERILNEALGGLFEHDLVNVSGELRNQYVKAGVLAGPIEWRRLFSRIKDLHFSPDGYFVATGFSKYVIVYNPSLVPADRVPKRWDDCLDPYWKGKLVVLARPRTFTGLYADWGEEKILSYATRLKNNQPVWKSSQSGSLAQIAVGEYPMICGIGYHTVKGLLLRDPKARIAVSVPSELPFQIGEAMGVMKGGKNVNAAVLLTGWLVSPEGQKGYEPEGSSSPFIEGTEASELIKKFQAKPIWGGWDVLNYEAALAKKITAAWGFPKARD